MVYHTAVHQLPITVAPAPGTMEKEWLLLSLMELALPWYPSLWVRTLTGFKLLLWYTWLFWKLFVWKLKAKLCIHKITGSGSGGSYNQPNRSPKSPAVCLLMFCQLSFIWLKQKDRATWAAWLELWELIMITMNNS